MTLIDRLWCWWLAWRGHSAAYIAHRRGLISHDVERVMGWRP
jgi:hypothetical protein